MAVNQYGVELTHVQYKCSHCGQTRTVSVGDGKPDPGRCPRRTGDRPHVWTKNRMRTRGGAL